MVVPAITFVCQLVPSSKSLVVSDGRNIGDGYGLDNDGTIVRVGAAEGTSLIEDKGMVELGRGHRAKTGSTEVNGRGISN